MKYRSFKEALAAQQQLSKAPASKRVVSSKNGRPAVQSDRVEDYLPVGDAHTESVISSRLRRR